MNDYRRELMARAARTRLMLDRWEVRARALAAPLSPYAARALEAAWLPLRRQLRSAWAWYQADGSRKINRFAIGWTVCVTIPGLLLLILLAVLL